MKVKKKNLFVKKWIWCSLAVLLLFSGSLCVLGEEAVEVGIDRAFTQNDKLYVYVNHNRGADFSATADNSELLLDNKQYGIEEICTLEKANVPVSYLFLVDISGSMDEQRIDTAKSVIHQFLEGKKEQDNFCIVTMGDDLTSSGFLDSPEEIGAWTDQIVVTNQDTNLYYSITEELKVLKTEQQVCSKRCLVILSDGADDQMAGITREEAETAVRDAHIPVFTVALLQEEPTENQVESAKILGSFSRYSAGGKYYAPMLEDYEAGDIYGDIQTILKKSLVVSADLNQVDIRDKNAGLQIKLSDGSQKAEDEVTIFIDAKEADQGFSGDLAIRQEEPEEESMVENTEVRESDESTAPLETPEPPEPIEEQEEGRKTGLIIGSAVGIILLIAVMVILVLVKKKKQQEEDTEEDDTEEPEDEKTYALKVTVSAEEKGGNRTAALKVTLFQIGQGETKEYAFKIKDMASMGRGKECTLSMPEDKALSEIHCTFLCRGKKIFVTDEASTNGTFVNGVPIAGEHELSQDDILLAGSYEYRVTWR